ncbi:hypothetical protein [Ferrimonas sp. YFM]|uniref:hypothetical protein n=1 Tax=Ferrimonas sp. YFM TaxID=3028878 RepID=UPI00257233EA|nr:hypothetical protein [Ferrimonas sp. YFM]BDY04671.1 hypothetical protein F0521_17120 [Ferrimonas sp. YFM]
MKIRIEEFLKSGRFGPLELGTSKDLAIASLGEPDCDADLGKTGSILLYGWYELFFNRENQLHSIQNDNYDPSRKESYLFKNEKIEIDPWFLNEALNQCIGDISRALEEKGMEYEVIDYYGRDAIKLKSGVVIDFDEEENDCGIKALTGIVLWP